MIQPTLLEKLEALPEHLQVEVLHYVEFLLEKKVNGKAIPIHESPKAQDENRYGYGSMAGQITMSDDFDKPLEELAEYM